jgi:hypothetical protein
MRRFEVVFLRALDCGCEDTGVLPRCPWMADWIIGLAAAASRYGSRVSRPVAPASSR